MRFGTDGVRGIANTQLTPEFALRLGRATARILGGPTISVGRDPRISGPMLEAAFVSGVCSEGVNVERLGVVPTPAVAFRSAQAGQPAAMISASHNAFGDNGIKVFATGGLKLSDDIQAHLEAELEAIDLDGTSVGGRISEGSGSEGSGNEVSWTVPTGGSVGSVTDYDVSGSYVAHVLDVLGEGTLAGLRVVLDCANGAASGVAVGAFERLGAHVTALHTEPNGTNINDACGSTYPASLQEAVLSTGADVGFAFDGDADRMLAVDASGTLVDGDQLIAINAIDLSERDQLAENTVVVTVMTNLGFRIAMADRGIVVVDTAVGDRYVLEALDAGSFVLGGEQSGHIIFRDLATTGDGLLSAAMTASVMQRCGKTLADLAAAAMTRLPQVLVNVRISAPMPDVTDRLASELAAAAEALGATGRVLVRPSGTEPVVRVMVEATELETAQTWANSLAKAVEAL